MYSCFSFFLDLTPEIQFLTRKLSKDWKFFMRALGVQDDDIESISSDYRQLREKIYQCFNHWLLEEQQSANKMRLIQACRHPSVRRMDLASKLEEGNYD